MNDSAIDSGGEGMGGRALGQWEWLGGEKGFFLLVFVFGCVMFELTIRQPGKWEAGLTWSLGELRAGFINLGILSIEMMLVAMK